MSQHNIDLKDRWNFNLGIELPNELQHHAKAIELMVAAVDMGSENLSPPYSDESKDQHSLNHRSNRLIIWLYDDSAGDMMRSIRALQRIEHLKFTIRISYCGDLGVPEYEAYLLTGCQLDCLQHSLLSYEPPYEVIKQNVELSAFDANAVHHGAEKASLRGTMNGTISSAATKASVMKLLQLRFDTMIHIINTDSK